jgi:hypothetical protein
MERLRHINYGKIFLVIFITILIWVWADQAQDQEYTFENVILKAERSLASDLWLTINGQRSIVIEELTLRGSVSRLDELRRDLKMGSPRMEFFINPEEVGFREPGEAAVNVLDFLRNSGRLRELRVSAISAKPEIINVKVSPLVEKEVPVRIVRPNGNVLNPKKVEPATVKVRVPQDWGPAVADVVLNESEIEQARLNDFEKNAVIRLNQDETYPVATRVKVMMPPQTEDLSPFSITQATIGFVLSPNLVGKYKVVLENYSELATFTISATPEAARAYREQPFQITLYILDEDAKDTAEQRKEVDYNFPEEFLRQNKIKLNQPAGIARFKLEPLQESAAAATP